MAEGVELVKNVFAMTTKCLDEIGRAGAFYHIIRRMVTMSDTALYELDDTSEFNYLPLSGEGVFGKGLEDLLKSRKEKKQQHLVDLVPDVHKNNRKRQPGSPNKTSLSAGQCLIFKSTTKKQFSNPQCANEQSNRRDSRNYAND